MADDAFPLLSGDTLVNHIWDLTDRYHSLTTPLNDLKNSLSTDRDNEGTRNAVAVLLAERKRLRVE